MWLAHWQPLQLFEQMTGRLAVCKNGASIKKKTRRVGWALPALPAISHFY
jgi:hypothetical protein